jgi:DNA polymerase-3 subunit gamma/tau
MSYQVLARKWRPSNFSQVAGQGHVLKSLINALDNERLHHAYLFTGTRGVGKTTLARILAKCLNCETGISSTPCEQCTACNEINEGRFVDLIEVDAASRTKVDDTRELLDNVQYSPSRGRFKVYLIDEVHMLSNHSFNALLKTLEEPPPHVKFLFATTDPQKLPVTILSRCLQFNLKNLSPELIENYLETILGKEQIGFEKDALWQIAAAAAGSMRDALTLVDQAIAFCEGEIQTDKVVEMLGVPPHQQIIELLRAMAGRDAPAALAIVASMAEQAPDYGNILDGLLSALHRIALAQVMPDAIDNSFGDRENISELAAAFSAEDIQLYYQIGSKGRDDFRYTTDLRAAFEMLLMRMLVFSPKYTEPPAANEGPSAANGKSSAKNEKPSAQNEEPSAQNEEPSAMDEEPSAADEEPAAGSKQPAAARDETAAATSDEPATESAQAMTATPPPAGPPDTGAADLKKKIDAGLDDASGLAPAAGELSAPEQQPSPASTTSTTAAEADSGDVCAVLADMDHERWLALFPQLSASGIVASVLANSVWAESEGRRITLRLDPSQSAVFNDDLLPRLEQVLATHFGHPVQVNVTIAEADQETPAALSRRQREENHQLLVSRFENDDSVQALLNRFSGKLLHETIAPVED